MSKLSHLNHVPVVDVYDPSGAKWKDKCAELEERIELALRLDTFFVGFVPDALKGRKFSELPQDVQDFLNGPALEQDDE